MRYLLAALLLVVGPALAQPSPGFLSITSGSGPTITGSAVNSSNHLIFTLSNGTTQDAGALPTGTGTAPTPVAQLPDSGVPGDTAIFAIQTAAGTAAQISMAEVFGYVQVNASSVFSQLTPVVMTGNHILDGKGDALRTIAACIPSGSTGTITLPPSTATLGSRFYTEVVNVCAGGIVAFGSGIQTLSTTLTAGQGAQIRYLPGASGANVLVALPMLGGSTGGAASTPAPAATIANVPATGWVVGTAKALTGATITISNASTVYAVLYDGTADVGTRQAVTSSATFAALSFTPATANATSTVRIYDAATAGNLLASASIGTVGAAANNNLPTIAPSNGNNLHTTDPMIVIGGLWEVHPYFPAANITGGGATDSSIWAVNVGSTATTGVNPQFTSVTMGWNPTPTGTAATASIYPPNPGNPTNVSSSPYLNQYTTFSPNNNVYWDNYNVLPSAPGTWYQIWTLTNPQGTYSLAVGPFTR